MRSGIIIASVAIGSMLFCPGTALAAEPHRAEVPSLEKLLGFPPGSRPASPEQLLAALERIAEASPRVSLEPPLGFSHEDRPLVQAVVGSERNLGRLDAIRSELLDLAAGSDKGPAASPSGEEEDLPVVIWIGGAIHGDEPSGGDAALSIVHHLAADTTAEVVALLDRVLLIVCPVLNPDGRARFLAGFTQWTSRVPNLDEQSLHHRAAWPTGRGNHYFIDLNRDWFAMSQPETRSRVAGILRWRPQVVLDLHEMRSFDTFLMSPPREPYNPHLPQSLPEWWRRFSREQAARFGERGWSCYTRDWHEEFNPNRGASWPLFTGAVAILQEQAGVDGSALRTPAGGTLTLRDAVEHHVVAALAVVEAAARDRAEILHDYRTARREARGRRDGAIRHYAIDDSAHPDQVRRLLETLLHQGIAIRRARSPFRAPGAVDFWGELRGNAPFPEGTYIVDLTEGEGRLARAILDFDPELGSEFLTQERLRLESNQPSSLYEAPAWSIAMAYGVRTYECREPIDESAERVTGIPGPHGAVVDAGASYGFLLAAEQVGYAAALSRLLGSGVKAWGCDEGFASGGSAYGPGTIVLRREENRPDLPALLEQVAQRTGAVFRGVDHPLVDEGPDLGSRAFRILQEPRIAILSGRAFYATTFGALWHFVDVELGLRASILSTASLAKADLQRYNVIIVPDGDAGDGLALVEDVGSAGFAALEQWIQRGGTLITTGEGAWLLFGAERPLCGIRDRRQVLAELPAYLRAAEAEEALGRLRIDERSLRDAPGERPAPEAVAIVPAAGSVMTEEQDAWMRRFSPQGAILRVNLNPNHWLSAGVGDRTAVLVKTELCLLGKQPAESVGRFADARTLRLSGLLWPEARERLARSIAVGRESVGDGQVIAFMGNPYYRAYFHGSARLLANGLLLGPGMGAKTRGGW